jgi:hypothetical protein
LRKYLAHYNSQRGCHHLHRAAKSAALRLAGDYHRHFGC